MKLYEITNEFVNLFNNDEISEEEYNEIGQSLAIALKEKSTDLVGYYLNENSDIEQLDLQIKRLTAMKKAKENRLDKYLEYIKSNMEKLQIEKIETELGKISIANNPTSVEIVDQSQIPQEYLKTETKITPDKKAILDNFKSTGEIIDGVRIITDKTNLRIK